MTSLRVLLHVAAQRDYELHSLDFSTAFLQGSLHEEIWQRRLPGFTGSFLAGTQWSLRRPIYSLREAPHEWHDTLRTTLAALGLAPSTADPSLFLRTDTSLPPFYFLVYVDDLVFAPGDTKALALVKSKLQRRHTCTDQGELRSYLGLQIIWDRARCTITLTQSHMVHQVLQRFGFRYSSPQSTPLPTGHSLSAPPFDESVGPSAPTAPLVALPCPARRAALLAACCPAVPVAPPCRPSAALPCPSSRPASRAPPCPACRAALPYQTHRPAGSTPPSPARRFALLATVSPCPARAPPCCPPRRPAAHRAALPYPRAALLAAAPSCPSRALPYWPPPCPANCAALPWPRAALP
ncbi:unnamed protein product [Closterium sp. NIES-54]